MGNSGGDEWQLVIRGSKKRRNEKRNTHRGNHHGVAAAVDNATKQPHIVYRYKMSAQHHRDNDKVVESEKEASIAKQHAIQQRVERILIALRSNPMVLEAVRVITMHFQHLTVPGNPQSSTNSDHSDTIQKQSTLQVVGYGLGSFVGSTNAMYQLAYLRALAETLANTNGKAAEIFDPVMTKSDEAIAKYFQLIVVEKNECGKRRVTSPTIFFMPHCGKTLYANVLASNWGVDLLNVIIIGNSFEAYNDRLIDSSARKASVLCGVLPYLEEAPLSSGIPKSHDEYVQYEAAFNDLSIHWFPSEKLHRALENEVLTQQMEAIVSKPLEHEQQHDELITTTTAL